MFVVLSLTYSNRPCSVECNNFTLDAQEGTDQEIVMLFAYNLEFYYKIRTRIVMKL